MEESYFVYRDPQNGQFMYVHRNSDGKRLHKGHPDYKDFLTWNERQERPVSIADYELPPGHVFCTDVNHVVETCRCRGITLFCKEHSSVCGNIECVPQSVNFKGVPVFQLREAAQRADGKYDGIEGRWSPIWVTGELLDTLNEQLSNPESDTRRVSSWPIRRTFVYLDVSDFSKTPAGQEVLIMNSLARMLNDAGHWVGHAHGLPEQIEARLCIGDGYIFVFKESYLAAYFAAYLAHVIELLIARDALSVSFHFRIGVHAGPVYTFWDGGRKSWNYIGDGIKGGCRVLAAMGKDYDDTVYISEIVRSELRTASAEAFAGTMPLLAHLHNRGRRADKHGRLWRVYEVNHFAVCSDVTLPPYWGQPV